MSPVAALKSEREGGRERGAAYVSLSVQIHVHVHPTAYVSLCVQVHLSLSVQVHVSHSVQVNVSPSAPLSLYPSSSAHESIYLSIEGYAHESLYLSINLSLYLCQARESGGEKLRASVCVHVSATH
jgi:hypothetical protein